MELDRIIDGDLLQYIESSQHFKRKPKAFTSIFTFIKGLEEQNPKDSDKIDTILNSENIAHIDNIYGTNIDQNLYTDIDSDNICTSGIYAIL